MPVKGEEPEDQRHQVSYHQSLPILPFHSLPLRESVPVTYFLTGPGPHCYLILFGAALQVSGWAPEVKEPEPRSLVLKFTRTPGLSWQPTVYPSHTR